MDKCRQRTYPYSSSSDEESLSEQTSAEESLSEQTSAEESSSEENEPKSHRKRTFSERQLEQLVSGFDNSSDDSDLEAIHCVVGKCYINLFKVCSFGYVIVRLTCFNFSVRNA